MHLVSLEDDPPHLEAYHVKILLISCLKNGCSGNILFYLYLFSGRWVRGKVRREKREGTYPAIYSN